MSFAKPSWIAVALLGADNAACVQSATSQTVLYGTTAGPLGGPDTFSGSAMTPFQMTALTTAVGTLLFADEKPLGWVDPGVEIEEDDWHGIATRSDLHPPETSPVPMGLDIQKPLAAATEGDNDPSYAAMTKVTGAALAALKKSTEKTGGVLIVDEAWALVPSMNDAATIPQGPGTTEPFAVILADTDDWSFSNLFVGDDAGVLARITDREPTEHLDVALWHAVMVMKSRPVVADTRREWLARAGSTITAAGIGEDRIFRGEYV